MSDLDNPFLCRVGMILSYSAVLASLVLGMVMFVQEIFIPLWQQLNA
ncbi:MULTISPECIES: hypothetical protein [Enterobacteriaceae]|nr:MULTISPECIES: hypothetical protein [Enterobacteriaceae]HDR2614742.1 hypothetical protein [Enterobacter ludwigii]KLV70738.1 hypothetical protein SK37_04988 [Citrobacter sp. MGH109]MDT7093082.1 hypothetical protein [Citrobacter freundii]QMT08941.1 hypothetical protein H1R18_26115 [Enterobacter kobei]CAI9395528.1 hypothetical protein CITSP_05012 [Citrobacter sp. T1.2D-1]